MRVKLGVVGLGYAGLCTAACFSQKFDVVGVDVDSRRVAELNSGKVPIKEKGLDALVRKGLSAGRLNFFDDYGVLGDADFIFVAVGTPSNPDGSIDLSQLVKASTLVGREIAKMGRVPRVVIKSTVVPGTAAGVAKGILERESGKDCGSGFGLCSNPEFLREGSAVEDTLKPDRIIIGSVDGRSGTALISFYRRFYGQDMPPVVKTTSENAELIKYASNSFLATKISFINLVADVCEALPGGDVGSVAAAMGLDPRIGKRYLQAGPGFGGSCFPKDLRALASYIEGLELDASLVRSVLGVNDGKPLRILSAVEDALSGLDGKEVALLGVAFKEESDDARESRAVVLAKALLAKGAGVRVYDPMATEGARRELGDSVRYSPSAKDCIRGADAAIVMTAWEEFRRLTPEDFLRSMRTPVLYDARRIYDPRKFSSGLTFMAVGSGT